MVEISHLWSLKELHCYDIDLEQEGLEKQFNEEVLRED